MSISPIEQFAFPSLPTYALDVLAVLDENGFEAWTVGGFVRDALLGRPCSDIDVASNASWTQAKSCMEAAGFDVVETGVKHGTITVLANGGAVEITTYRIDGAYKDGRRPECVSRAGSIVDDLARRDYTCNAIAYHPDRGFVDPFSGIEDIRNHVIRAVGNPEQRFAEDALRILRACRFRSQLGFDIEPATSVALRSSKHLLYRISAERITMELQGLLLGDHAREAIVECFDVISYALPEITAMKGFAQHTPYHIYDVLEHTAWAVHHSPGTPLSRWAALFHDIGKPASYFMDSQGTGHFYGHARISRLLAEQAMTRLKFPSKLKHEVLLLVEKHDDIIEQSTRAVKRALSRLDGNPELFSALCALKRADALSQAPFCHERARIADNLEAIMRDIVDSQNAFDLSHLEISGHDIIALGATPGPRIGAILDKALDAVIEESLPNERKALLEFAENELFGNIDR